MKMIEAKTAKEAKKLAPEAVKVVKVEGGYMAFSTWDAYKTWKNQK